MCTKCSISWELSYWVYLLIIINIWTVSVLRTRRRRFWHLSKRGAVAGHLLAGIAILRQWLDLYTHRYRPICLLPADDINSYVSKWGAVAGNLLAGIAILCQWLDLHTHRHGSIRMLSADYTNWRMSNW